MTKNVQDQLVDSLLAIMSVLKLTPSEFADYAEMTPGYFQKILQKRTQLKCSELFRLSDKLGIEESNLLNGKYDPKILFSRFYSKSFSISEEYLEHANSSTNNIRCYLDYILDVLGTEAYMQILKRFQLTPETLESSEKRVNLKLGVHILRYCQKLFPTSLSILRMGQSFWANPRNDALKNQLSPAKNVEDILELFFTSIIKNDVESNFRWSVERLNASECTIVGLPQNDLLTVFDDDCVNSIEAIRYRAGFLSGLVGQTLKTSPLISYIPATKGPGTMTYTFNPRLGQAASLD